MMSLILFSQQNNSDKIINAVTIGNLELVASLLDKGIDANTQNKQKKSLLYLATELDYLEMVDLLLKKGVLVDFPFDKDRTKEQEGFDVIDPTPLLYAGAHGQTKIIERLIKESPNLEIRNHYGGNALIPAAEKGHYKTAKVLLEKTDIDIDFINYLGWTALLEVVLLSKDKDMQVKMSKLLLDHGADISIKDNDGLDALAHAKKKNYKELVKLLESYKSL
jgi:ankyrin repeat protein